MVSDVFEWRPEIGFAGALCLRVLQGRLAMLPTQLLSVLHKPVANAFVTWEGCEAPVKTRKDKG
jgi:hypothetical protein